MFKRMRELLNQEFVIGPENVRRYNEDPDSLQDILREQRSRGLGSTAGLKQHAREIKAEREALEPPKPTIMKKVASAAVKAGVVAAGAVVTYKVLSYNEKRKQQGHTL